MALLPIDGSQGEGGGQILRTALSLSMATGQGFELTRIRAQRPRPGLQPHHLAAVRAAAFACGARVGGVFDGSPDLRFEPGPVAGGDFRFETATAGAATLVLQTVLTPLARVGAASRIVVTGGTHVPASPSFDYLARHWSALAARLGFSFGLQLERAGFYPPGGGEVRAEVRPSTLVHRPLVLEERGALVGVRGISGAGRVKGDVAQRQRDAAAARLWEHRRLESSWEVREVKAESPGSFLLLEAEFEQGRAAFGLLGQRGLRAEVLGDRAARTLLRFLEGEGAVDPHLADQLAVPLALAGGGRVSTSEVTAHLQTVADVAGQFGIPASTWGRLGSPGGLEIGPVAPAS
jgi:RNA 3'-terminal phosphate cyclase (ATP)